MKVANAACLRVPPPKAKVNLEKAVSSIISAALRSESSCITSKKGLACLDESSNATPMPSKASLACSDWNPATKALAVLASSLPLETPVSPMAAIIPFNWSVEI